ncbi:MAG: hypothetical protein V4548_07990 [Bacteroidota bacterium]
MNLNYIIISITLTIVLFVLFRFWSNIKNWNGWKIWLEKEGWKYIAVNLAGNLFPVWFLLIIEFGNNGINKDSICKTLAQPYTYLVLLVAFASSTLYLWIKNIKSEENEGSKDKSKISIGLILYVLFLFPIVGFYLNKKDCLEHYKFGEINKECEPIVNIIYILFVLTVLIYIYFQLKDFSLINKLNKKSNPNPTKSVDDEIKDLNNQLNNIK